MKTLVAVWLVLLLVLAGGSVAGQQPAQSPANQVTLTPADLTTAVDQANALLRAYQLGGRTAEAKARVMAYLERCDAVFRNEPRYLLAKADIFQGLGEDALYARTFEQVPDDALVTPLHLINRISRSYMTRPAATAALVRRLAVDQSPRARALVMDWVHDSLAQQFAPEIKSTIGTRLDPLLEGLCTPDEPALCAMTSGLRVWVKAQRAAADPAALKSALDAGFGGYGSYGPRYRLLLAGLADRQPELRQRAVALREAVIAELGPAAEAPDLITSRQDKRAMRDYWLAFAFHAQAAAALATGDDREGLRLLREAADASRRASGYRVDAYFYEGVTLGGRPEYVSPLAEYLERRGRKEDALDAWAGLARIDPRRLGEVRRLHALVSPTEPFDRYWAQQRLEGAPRVPELSLLSVAGKRVKLSDFRGKWVLVDFWGTWCEPCVADAPRMEQLYQKVAASGARAAILTVASDDTLESVTAFMRERRLTYPVLMGDAATLARFKVDYYPYRILVAPDGRFIEIGGSDWASQAEAIMLPVETKTMAR